MQYGEHGALDSGEMTEWLKVHAWKVCIPQKGIVGSNPAFSAKKIWRPKTWLTKSKICITKNLKHKKN